MTAATLTSKGQITIPVAVREKLGLAAGDRVEFVEVGPGEFALKAATEDVRSLKGMVRRPSTPVSVGAMNAAIRTSRIAAMIGLDTNVLVRYIAQDDPRQTAKAVHLIEDECSEARPGFVTAIAVAELVWVLEECYQSAKAEIVAVLQRILRARQLVVEEAETMWKAVRLFEASRADFAGLPDRSHRRRARMRIHCNVRQAPPPEPACV